jgi:hypothetical protein
VQKQLVGYCTYNIGLTIAIFMLAIIAADFALDYKLPLEHITIFADNMDNGFSVSVCVLFTSGAYQYCFVCSVHTRHGRFAGSLLTRGELSLAESSLPIILQLFLLYFNLAAPSVCSILATPRMLRLT